MGKVLDSDLLRDGLDSAHPFSPRFFPNDSPKTPGHSRSRAGQPLSIVKQTIDRAAPVLQQTVAFAVAPTTRASRGNAGGKMPTG